MLNICENTLIKKKNELIEKVYLYYINNENKIGGNRVIVQVDEPAVKRRRLIKNPTTQSVEDRNTVWLIGAVEEAEK